MASLISGHELGQTLGHGEGQGGLACCSPWGLTESDMTGQLNNNNKNSPVKSSGSRRLFWGGIFKLLIQFS